MIGVSPAYFISRFSSCFTIDDYIKGIRELSKSKFDAFQAETYLPSELNNWVKRAKEVLSCANDEGIRISQYVAHFLLDIFSCEDLITSSRCVEEWKKAIEVANILNVDTITLPINAYEDEKINNNIINYAYDKLILFCMLGKKANLNIGIELPPYSIFKNSIGLIKAIEDTELDNLGLNFDTGHAILSGDNIYSIPSLFSGRIYATHLKDISKKTDTPILLGEQEGVINWAKLLNSLKKEGYGNSFDIEFISTEKEEATINYEKGRDFLLQILQSN